MSYRLITSLQLGATEITDLRAQLLNPDGTNFGSVITTGFTADLGGGQYLWDYSSYPDGFHGAVAFYRSSAPGTRWIHAINPQEGENVDARITALPEMVWGNSVRTLSSFGTLLADLATAVWGAAERTLTAFGSNTLIEFTYTLTDSVTTLPLSGASIRISTDSGGNNTVWSGLTDAFGVARDAYGGKPRLAAGTYYIWRSLSGYTFSDPDVEVANA